MLAGPFACRPRLNDLVLALAGGDLGQGSTDLVIEVVEKPQPGHYDLHLAR